MRAGRIPLPFPLVGDAGLWRLAYRQVMQSWAQACGPVVRRVPPLLARSPVLSGGSASWGAPMTWSLVAKDVPSSRSKENGLVPVPPSARASWQKSRLSNDADGACVEIARTQETVWIRDSKDPLGSVLGFTREGWAAFIVGVQRREFDRSVVIG